MDICEVVGCMDSADSRRDGWSLGITHVCTVHADSIDRIWSETAYKEVKYEKVFPAIYYLHPSIANTYGTPSLAKLFEHFHLGEL